MKCCRDFYSFNIELTVLYFQLHNYDDKKLWGRFY